MPRIGILSLSAIADDPRVRRQGDTLATAGYPVIGFGLEGARTVSPDWPIRTIAPDASLASTPKGSAARLGARLADLSRVALEPFVPGAAEEAYWRRSPAHLELYELARCEPAELWLANDWNTLPIAARLSREHSARYIYDTHELAIEEYADSLKWRLLHRPFVRATEGSWISGATHVSCVSSGIARYLQRTYKLEALPTVIRSIPNYQPSLFRPTGETIEVLYHGAVAPGRSLEACIASIAAWRPEMRLTIRGPAKPSYREHLLSLARETQAEGRVRLAPAVTLTELVNSAAAYDIGAFVLEDNKWHNRFVLPNKVFEYLMAGLALCVSDLPELRHLVAETRAGVLIPQPDPAAIAAAINALDRNRIDELKRNALAAAKVLNWELESRKFLAGVERALLSTA